MTHLKDLRLWIAALAALAASVGSTWAQNPKREFRGAWVHTVFQDQYKRQSTSKNKAYIRNMLDSLAMSGVNAVLFQVRPQSDAFYQSRLEPWSRFLTDGGRAPEPFWDPLQFMIDECHGRGMELHAWLNPYRVTSSKNQTLPAGHIYHKHPERFIRYDGKLYFDPALAENREHIVRVVADIVERYDVDGIHFDDYFYPYPVKGKKFADDESYAKYGKGKDMGDWRRGNVDALIESVHNKIMELKPWVVFGVSPFGIWRNKTSDPRGSDTRGLQNYDALYADVVLWADKGWVDYLIPQLYWDLNHSAASYLTLVDWWASNIDGCNLYIGQSVSNTMTNSDPDLGEESQLRRKVELTRTHPTIQGNCWWPAYDVVKNVGGVADSLMIEYQATVAVMPQYRREGATIPEAVADFRFDKGVLRWSPAKPRNTVDDATKFVVYRFEPDEAVDLENSEAIEAVLFTSAFKPEYPGKYVVTALSRVNRESKPSKPIVINE